MTLKYCVILCSISLIFACSNEANSKYACQTNSTQALFEEFEYSEFGPDVIASTVLGQSWYQWLPYGGGDISKEFDIKVIVHATGANQLAEDLFPIDQKAQKDYRYLSYDEALSFLEQAETDVAEAISEGIPMESVAATLENTKTEIMEDICPSVSLP